MATPTTPPRSGTSETVAVHDLLRRGFGDLPGLVRGVAPGDAGRASVVVGFLRELAAGLHHHLSVEDELVWPVLLERATADAALVLRMEEQHQRLACRCGRALVQATAFAADADAGTGDRLARTLTALGADLGEHLREEEDRVLPLIERHLTVAERRLIQVRGRRPVTTSNAW